MTRYLNKAWNIVVLFLSPIVDCGDPDPPVNGSFGGDITSTVEGSEITYQCDDGLAPEGTMTAVCGQDGEWRPNPGDVECRSTTEDSKSLYTTWDPDPAHQMCRETSTLDRYTGYRRSHEIQDG